jgi:hypothetical protein
MVWALEIKDGNAMGRRNRYRRASTASFNCTFGVTDGSVWGPTDDVARGGLEIMTQNLKTVSAMKLFIIGFQPTPDRMKLCRNRLSLFGRVVGQKDL